MGDYSVSIINLYGVVTSFVVRLTVVPTRTLVLGSPPSSQEGTTITLPFDLISEGDVGGMTFVLRYDTNYLRNTGFDWSEGFKNAFSTVNDSVVGQLQVTFAFPGEVVPAGTQSVATL